MGLDQYLYARKYLSPSEWIGKETNNQYETVINAVGATSVVTDQLPSATVEVSVGYWRKVNAVHQWFVDNCQNGEDDCRQAYVSREALTTLRDLCQQVLNDHSLAEELLPTQAGFFFGSTEYDEYYFGDLADTICIIDDALSCGDEWTFAYQSSW